MTTPQLTHKALTDYTEIIGQSQIRTIERLSAKLRGKKIYEINATSTGGGVAELLRSYVPLMRSLGVDADWLVLPPDKEFFDITKSLHNCLQGKCELPVLEQLDYYLKYSELAARKLPQDGDLYILHDPQTLGLVAHLDGRAKLWRCHIDLTEADTATLNWVKTFYPHFERVIFSMDEYVQGLDHHKVEIIRPAIDPLTDKNRELSELEIDKIIRHYNIDLHKPYILQVSRFDQFKNPIGVLELYAKTRQIMPELQCVLMGNYATDDPEGKPYYEKVLARARELGGGVTMITEDNDVAVNALQRRAAVVIQNSTKEGFGLTVTEAMWKSRLVFSRPVGGIAVQILDNATGFYLEDDTDYNAHKLASVVRNPAQYDHVARAAHQRVQHQFLITKMLENHLRLYGQVIV